MHAKAIEKAVELRESAEIAFVQAFGFSPWVAPEFAPGWVAAKEAVEALRNEDGFYWAASRLTDIAMLTEGQTMLQTGLYVWKLGGEVPELHASVAPWLASKVFAWTPGERVVMAFGAPFVMGAEVATAA